jgi:hypothetical protein
MTGSFFWHCSVASNPRLSTRSSGPVRRRCSAWLKSKGDAYDRRAKTAVMHGLELVVTLSHVCALVLIAAAFVKWQRKNHLLNGW